MQSRQASAHIPPLPDGAWMALQWIPEVFVVVAFNVSTNVLYEQ
jgi:hypothetical protein